MKVFDWERVRELFIEYDKQLSPRAKASCIGDMMAEINEFYITQIGDLNKQLDYYKGEMVYRELVEIRQNIKQINESLQSKELK